MTGLSKVPGSVLAYVGDCARRLREDPHDPEGLYARALILSSLGRGSEGREAMQTLRRVAPHHPAAVRLPSDRDPLPEGADGTPGPVLTYVGACARRLERNPRDPDALFARAAILATLGQHKDALHSLELLASVVPHYPAVWRLKARLYKDIGDARTAALCIRAAERFERDQTGDGSAHGMPPEDADLIKRMVLHESR